MKRFATAAVAVATALSLSTGAAMAAEEGSSEGVSGPHAGSVEASSNSLEGSSEEQAMGSAERHLEFYESSYENDLKNEYAPGTTADILWGVGIAAAVIGALLAGAQQAGIALPAIPGLPN